METACAGGRRARGSRCPGCARLRCVGVSLFLRTRELGIGFWIDEGLSVGISDRPLSQIPHALREDGSPPLYYMLLHFWLGIGGHSEGGVRALSLLFALLAIPVAWWAGRAIFRTPRAAWIAAVLMAFNPFLSQYAQEARMYSLVALLTIPATACFLRAYALDAESGARRPWIAGFAVSVAAALYTHNWPIFFTIAAAGAWARLWWLAAKGAGAELVRDGLLGFGGAVVLYLPWVPTTLYQAAHTGAPWSETPSLDRCSARARRCSAGRRARAADLRRGRPARAAARPQGGQRFTERGAGLGRSPSSPSAPCARLDAVARLARLGQPLPRRRRCRRSSCSAAGGLAFAGRLGLVGLALVAVMWAQDTAP